jgi:putative FmdB family regulatory protein
VGVDSIGSFDSALVYSYQRPRAPNGGGSLFVASSPRACPHGKEEAVPIYTYRCNACESTLEKRQSFSDAPLTTCESCGGSLSKVIHAPGIHFRGSGFYNTDYKNTNGTAASNGSDSESKSGESKASESKSSEPAKSESSTSTESSSASDAKPAAASTTSSS